MRSFRILALSFLAACVLPGCAWFVIGGAAAVALLSQGKEEAQTAPAVVLTAPSRLVANPAMLPFQLIDAEGDPCGVAVEYSVNGGAFHPATPGAGGEGTQGLAASSGGAVHLFSWDFSSGADLTPPETGPVTLRITATDSTGRRGEWVSAGHTTGNAPPSISGIVLPAGDVSGTTTVEYTISDSLGDTAEIEIQFKRESDGTDWALYGHAAAPDASDPAMATSNRATSATGITHLFPWDTTDLNAQLWGEDADVRIRIRARDAVDGVWGGWVESGGAFSVRNDHAPSISLGVPDPIQSGLVRIAYTVTDVEGHATSILAEWQIQGDATWERATAGPGTTVLSLNPSPGGTSGVFVWDSKRDGAVGRSVLFRLLPSQSAKIGPSEAALIRVNNDASDNWNARRPAPAPEMRVCGTTVGSRFYVFGASGTYSYDPAFDTWETRTVMPVSRYDCGCCSLNGKAYVIGGYVSPTGYFTAVHEYSPETDAWSIRQPLPLSRNALAAVALREKIYAIGGGRSSGPVTNVDEYDPRTNAWTPRAALPSPTFRICGAAANGLVYVFGNGSTVPLCFDPVLNSWSARSPVPGPYMNFAGCGAFGDRVFVAGGETGGAPVSVLSSVWEYDTRTDSWASRTPISTGRAQASVSVFQDKMLASCGSDGSNLDSTEAYDPPAQDWAHVMRTPAYPAVKASMPTARQGVGTAVVQGKIYVVGGYDGSNVRNVVERFDPATATWTALAAMPTARTDLGCSVLNGKIFAVGGANNVSEPYAAGKMLNVLEEYDPTANAWTTRTSMPTARADLGCAAAGGCLYAIGGGWVYNTSGNHTDKVERYDPSTQTWQTAAPLPGAAGRVRHACVAWNGRIYCIGGGYSSVWGLNGYWTFRGIDVYDPAQDTWAEEYGTPLKVISPACTVVDGTLVMTGGYRGTPLDESAAYDPGTKKWTYLAPLPSGRFGHGFAWVNGRGYSVGGYDGTARLAELLELAPRVSILRPLADLPNPANPAAGLSGAVLAGIPDRVLLAGGGDAAVRGGVSTMPLLGDIPAGDSSPFTIPPEAWIARASLPAARKNAASAAYNGSVFVAGGFDGTGAPVDTILKYSSSTDTWSTLAATLASARGGLGGARVGDRFFLYGGQLAGGTKTGALEVLNLQTETLDAGPFNPVGTARSHFGAGADSETGMIYAVGGEAAGGAPMNSVEACDTTLATPVWTAKNNLPMALEGCLCLYEGHRLRLFGGEVNHPTVANTMTAQILTYDASADAWRIESATLPYAARDLAGCAFTHSWRHRAAGIDPNQSDEFCFLGGGFDGTSYRKGFFRFTTR